MKKRVQSRLFPKWIESKVLKAILQRLQDMAVLKHEDLETIIETFEDEEWAIR